MKTLLLAVRQPVERSLVLGRRIEERLGDRGLQIFRKLRIIGIGSVDDRRRLVDDPEIILLHRRAVGILLCSICASVESSSLVHWLAATSTVPCDSASKAFSWLPVNTTLPK